VKEARPARRWMMLSGSVVTLGFRSLCAGPCIARHLLTSLLSFNIEWTGAVLVLLLIRCWSVFPLRVAERMGPSFCRRCGTYRVH